MLTVHWSVDAPVQFHALLYVPEKAPFDLVPEGAQGPAPLRQARPHHGGLRQADAAVPSLPPRRRRLRGPLAQRLARDAPGEPGAQPDRGADRQAGAQGAQGPRRGRRGEVPRLLPGVRPRPQGGRRPRLEEPRRHRRALPLRVDDGPRRASSSRSRSTSRRCPRRRRTSTTSRAWAAARSSRARTSRPSGSAATTSSSSSTRSTSGWSSRSSTSTRRRLRSVAHGDIDLGDAPEQKQGEAEVSAAVAAVKKALGDRVKDVRASRRLTDSASVLVAAEGDPGRELRAHHADGRAGRRRPRPSASSSSTRRTRS